MCLSACLKVIFYTELTARGTSVQQADLIVIFDIFSVYFFGLDPNSHSTLLSCFLNTIHTVLYCKWHWGGSIQDHQRCSKLHSYLSHYVLLWSQCSWFVVLKPLPSAFIISFFSSSFPLIIYPLMPSFMPCILTKPTWIKYKICSLLLLLTDLDKTTQTGSSVFVALHSLPSRSSQDNRTASGMTDRKYL